MANTLVSTENQVQQWDDRFFVEYVRDNLFKPYMGTSMNDTIVMKENLTKMRGDRITVSLVRKLRGAGVTGASTLEGNEEMLANHGHQITVDVLRNAVSHNEFEQQKTVIDIRNAARDALMMWAMERLRDDVIDALYSPDVNGVTKYADATVAQRNAWHDANDDRISYGGDNLNNFAAGNHAASLANIVAADELLTNFISLAKRQAKTTTKGAIRPIRVNGSEEWFVLFANPLCFRDLKNDPVMQQANRDAWIRGRNNPIFRDGDLMWDGVIIREVPEIPVLAGVGGGGIDVAANFLCGAQAIGVAWAQRTTSRLRSNTDYGFVEGVGIQEIRGVEKLTYDFQSTVGVQHGVFTMFHAAVPDP